TSVCESLLAELGDELAHVAGDLVADLAHALDRLVLRIGDLPCDVALAGNDRTRAVARGHDDVRPRHRLVVELAWNVVGRVDADLAERLDHLRMRRPARHAPGRAGGVAATALTEQESLRHLAPAAVRRADEEHVHSQPKRP